MSETLTPERAEQAIQFYLHQLGELVGQYAEAADLKATTEAAYRLQHATARTEYRHKASQDGSKTTESVVDDIATIQTFDALSARLMAAAREESTKLALRACQSKLDGARSLAANVRIAVG